MLCENCGFEYFVNPSAATVAFILNSKGELLVERRKREPAKGTLDLPGGFADMDETAEQGVAREVLEALLDKYMNSGIYEIEKTEILRLDPFMRLGKPSKIASYFGGKEGYLKAIQELEDAIYMDEVA